MEPKQISDSVWFDEFDGIIIVGMNKMSIEFSIEEFIKHCAVIDAAKEKLINDFNLMIVPINDSGEMRFDFMFGGETNDEIN